MALYDDTAGRPIQKVFNRIGIRRDQNFADLSSPTTGLGNLIDTLVDDDENTFIAEDLGVINNIFSRGLTNSNYLSVAGSALRFVSPDGTREDYFDPRITYQNRLDKIKVFSGEPRLAGGNGLTAKYYQNDQINFDEHDDLAGIGTGFEYNINPNFPAGIATATPSGDIFTGITTLGNLPDDNFWEEGDFSYTTKIHPQSVKSNTGVKWEGYFTPSITGPVEFQITSTGYFTFDFNQEGYAENQNSNETNASKNRPVGAGQTYTNYARVGVSTSFQVNSSGAGNVITVNTADVGKLKTIGHNMTVAGSNIELGAEIAGISRESDPPTITLTSDAENSVKGSFTNQTVTFSRDLNDSVSVISEFNTHVLEAYQRYRIRIRYFHHKNFDSKDILQSIDINHRQRNEPFQNDLRYTRLFSLDYNFTNAVKGDFNKYNDQSVLFGGTDTEGIGSRTDQSGLGYSKISTSNKVDIKYQPKQELGDGTNIFTGITRSEISVQKVAGSQILETGSSLTTNIEVGNYIIGSQSTTNASVSFFARVSDLLENEFIVMDIPALAGSTHTETIRFIDHRGFIRRVRVNNSSGTTITSSVSTNPFRGTQSANPDMTTIHKDVQVGMIAIGANIPAFTRVTAINSQTSLTLSASVSVSANQDVFFYDSKGLRDNSLQNFCDRIDTSPTVRCLISNVSSTLLAGTTVITVDDVKNVGVGWELQGSYFGQDGITVSAVNSGTNQITLNSGIERSLPDNAQFTAVESIKSTGDYTLCCPPTDTSPPFDASEQGLDTIPTHKDLGIESGNLKFDSLVLQDDEASNNATDLTVSQGTDVNRTIDIKTPSGTFKILATT